MARSVWLIIMFSVIIGLASSNLRKSTLLDEPSAESHEKIKGENPLSTHEKHGGSRSALNADHPSRKSVLYLLTSSRVLSFLFGGQSLKKLVRKGRHKIAIDLIESTEIQDDTEDDDARASYSDETPSSVISENLLNFNQEKFHQRPRNTFGPFPNTFTYNINQQAGQVSRSNPSGMSDLDDGCMTVFQSDTFMFYSNNYNGIKLCVNGVLSFGSWGPGRSMRGSYPLLGQPFIAPFWCDIDISSNAGGESGIIYYEKLLGTSPNATEYNSLIRQQTGLSSFNATRIYLFTWLRVAKYGSGTTPHNTFQVAIVSDSSRGFVFLRYGTNGITWSSSTSVGINSGNYVDYVNVLSSMSTSSLSTQSNIGATGIWLFEVGVSTAYLQREYLHSFYASTNGDDWKISTNWLVGVNMCIWSGLYCLDGCDPSNSQAGPCPIRRIDLSNNNLRGTLNSLKIPFVSDINLSHNEINGTIPDIESRTLQSLNLGHNNLTGTVPNLIPQALTTLKLNGNQLSGSVPSFSRTNLIHLDISENQITGTVPSFSDLGLRELFLRRNNLTGIIPTLPPSLRNISLDENPSLIYPRESLEQFYKFMKGENWDVKDGWLEDVSVCSWYGVHCDDSCSNAQNQDSWCPIDRLSLPDNRLKGEIPSCTWVSRFPTGLELILNSNMISGTLDDFCFENIHIIDFSNNKLDGEIRLINASFLNTLRLSRNNFTGSLPILDTPSLEVLDLSNNIFSGSVVGLPSSITELRMNSNGFEGLLTSVYLPEVIHLDLSQNKFSGNIPLFSAQSIEFLALNDNNLTGTLPWNIPHSLNTIWFQNNRITGTIPSEYMLLDKLSLEGNQLTGTIPYQPYPMYMQYLSLARNKLTDYIPSFYAGLLKELYLNDNLFEGYFPLMNTPALEILDLSRNQLAGTIPDIHSLLALKILRVSGNFLKGSFPNLLNDKIEELDISNNRLTGSIPDFSKMVLLRSLDLSNNSFEDKIPEFEQLEALLAINLSRNILNGTIPRLQRLKQLHTIDFSHNLLTGTLSDLKEKTNLKTFKVSNNRIGGSIPVFLAPSLEYIDIDNNNELEYVESQLKTFYERLLLSKCYNNSTYCSNRTYCNWEGVTCHLSCKSLQKDNNLCPVVEISLDNQDIQGHLSSLKLSHLESLTLSNNRINGTIPELYTPNLVILDLSNNRITGSLPPIDSKQLQQLYLQNNEINGTLPQLSFSKLESLDLSHNKIEGTFPSLLNSTALTSIDISSNNFIAIANQSLPELESFFAFRNKLSEPLPELDFPKVTVMDLSFNELRDPLPDWPAITKIERLLLSPNKDLTGPLPSGLDNATQLQRLDISNTSMVWKGRVLLPKVLFFSGKYKLENTNDNFQCPVVQSNQDRSSILMTPDYYGYINCRCLPGNYGNREICIPCPVECDCSSGLALDGCFPAPSSENITHIIPCPNPSACMIQSPDEIITVLEDSNEFKNACAEGYDDRVCSKCKSGYGTQGRSCVKCQDFSTYASFVLVPLFFGLFITYLYKSSSQASGKLNILIFHVQTLSVIATAMSNTPAIDKVVNLSFSIGSIQIPNLSCFLGNTDVFLPIAISYVRLPALIIIGYIFYRKTTGHAQDKASL
eukprot:TRINITY_DN10135_c0_g1_i9.p1 TRINITY_DN10135_c0_g1~~TRINITY_DN10135_c0_g1_i9.p1  ORF type:complete len:1609 (+),score=225.44 TRINITY_DN10135_c0_g1_i9:95-4921(+)